MDERRGRKDSRRPSFTAELDDLALLEGTVAEDLDGAAPNMCANNGITRHCQAEVMQPATASNPVTWRNCQKRASDNRTTVCRSRMNDAGVDFDPPPDLTDQDIDCEILCEVEADEAQGPGRPDTAERTTQSQMLAGPRRSSGLFSQVMAKSCASGRMTFSHADAGRLTSGHLPGRSTFQDRRSANDLLIPGWKTIRSEAEVAAASELQPWYVDPLMQEFDALPLVSLNHFACAACSSEEVASSSVADPYLSMQKAKDAESMQRPDTVDSAAHGFSDVNTQISQPRGGPSATSQNCGVGAVVPSGAALAMQWEAALARAEAAERRAEEAEKRALAAEHRLASIESSYAQPIGQSSLCSGKVDLARCYNVPSPVSSSGGPRAPAGPKPSQSFARKVVSNDVAIRPVSAPEDGLRHSKGDHDDGDISNCSSGRAKGQRDRQTSLHSSDSARAVGSGRHAAQWLSAPKTP